MKEPGVKPLVKLWPGSTEKGVGELWVTQQGTDTGRGPPHATVRSMLTGCVLVSNVGNVC